MASSIEMAEAIGDALGVGRQTLRHHLRNLVALKLISYSGRGRHAARMTSLDAARLVIAAAGSPMVKDSATTWRRFARLSRSRGRQRVHGRYRSPVDDRDEEIYRQSQLPDADPHAPATALEDFLALRIDRLRDGYPERRDRQPYREVRWSDRLPVAALELCGSAAPGSSDFRAYAVVRWWPPGGRAERALFCDHHEHPIEQPADLFVRHPGLGVMTARFVSADALQTIARASGV